VMTLNADASFSAAQAHAAKTELNARNRKSILAAFDTKTNGDAQSQSLALLSHYSSMSAAEKSAMTALIQRVRAQYGVTFLIVEHDIPVIMDISDKIVVLDFGRKIAEGAPQAVQSNPAVIAAYLGTGH